MSEFELEDVEIGRAAAAIVECDALLLATGAGWSADSDLPVYDDIAELPAYRSQQMTYAQLASPACLKNDPELFYGFWGSCLSAHRDATPHDGHRLVARWRGELCRAHELSCTSPPCSPFFAITSNVDGHLPRTFEHAYQIHGSTEWWQCASERCAQALRREVRLAARGSGAGYLSGAAPGDCALPVPDAALADGRWRAPSGYRVEVDATTARAASGHPAAAGVVGSKQPRDAAAFRANWPACVRCGGVARPAVCMFADSGWLSDVEEHHRWDRWREEVAGAAARADAASPFRLCVLEVGAGATVPTVRQMTEQLVARVNGHDGGRATLVRINPQLPHADSAANALATIPIAARGADALRMIDAALGARAASSDARGRRPAAPLPV